MYFIFVFSKNLFFVSAISKEEIIPEYAQDNEVSLNIFFNLIDLKDVILYLSNSGIYIEDNTIILLLIILFDLVTSVNYINCIQHSIIIANIYL